ncbi:DUF3592 domain-containing protein [Hyphococcus luteus]|uniref:DUF3592 domain-containing protein n=1 Tax=Hyphococcus luteus TaxID=2058213 RepID=A0A2S7K805_9PROT|nr:DUF3592 domain-containing protein [Marinicaulis flavus]PQA88630.1 hypothetical protein CW354_10135 [Marinicaulis flavus]
MGGSVFLTLFFGLFLAVGVGILGFGLHSLHMSQQAEHWPTTPGTITASDFKVNSDSDGDTYQAKVEYTYNADSYERTGEKIVFGYAASSSRGFHQDIHDALPVGSQVAVRYNPANPDQAVLSFGVNQSIKFLMIFGAVWTMFTLGMVAMVWLSGQGATTLLDNMLIYSTGR